RGAKSSPLREEVSRGALKKFVREHEDLFAAEDMIWKERDGKANPAWCRAFQALGRPRPTCAKHLSEWHGWRWAE
ncbi:MAG: hypothetical protein ACOYOF_22300, partial [Verrucomicrobiaceae bacterium]